MSKTKSLKKSINKNSKKTKTVNKKFKNIINGGFKLNIDSVLKSAALLNYLNKLKKIIEEYKCIPPHSPIFTSFEDLTIIDLFHIMERCLGYYPGSNSNNTNKNVKKDVIKTISQKAFNLWFRMLDYIQTEIIQIQDKEDIKIVKQYIYDTKIKTLYTNIKKTLDNSGYTLNNSDNNISIRKTNGTVLKMPNTRANYLAPLPPLDPRNNFHNSNNAL